MDEKSPPKTLTAGQALARGVSRHFAQMGVVTLCEFTLKSGLRADVIGLDPKGNFFIVECKSGRADFRADRKWEGYLPWCDRFYWAVATEFPIDILPQETGVMVADAYDAAIFRGAPTHKLAAARRKALMQRFAQTAARRLQNLLDPPSNALGSL